MIEIYNNLATRIAVCWNLLAQNIKAYRVIKLVMMLLALFTLSACAGKGSKPIEEDIQGIDQVGSVPAEESRPIDPLLAQDYNDALAFIDQGELVKADRLLIKIAETYPDLAAPLYNLGIIAEAQQDLDNAVSFYKQAIEKDKNYYLAFNNLGVIARTLGNFEDARDYYQQGLTVAPDNPELHYNMAVLNEIYLHDYAKAVEHYERYLTLNNEKSEDKKVANWIKDLKRRSR
ncbi:tetratricopeptide repeat protein [Alkalimarinus coralli]|uniref:tetratricopeptide repeat protein n=1 Tax=Alkalimarinus coralli TaxID=2935863 RepID=UPI00202B9745|nr:tetratricopeptide repeat protein [Alkalimarinus coralli]